MDRFPYLEIVADPSYADRSNRIWRPLVPYSVRGLSGRFDGKALVDTGANEEAGGHEEAGGQTLFLV